MPTLWSAVKIILLALAIALLVYILLLITSALLVDTHREYETHSRFYRWLLNSATALVLFFGRVKLKVTGMEKVPRDSRFLLVSNHRSKFDPITTWLVFRKHDVAFISKPENFDVPIFGRIIRKCCFLAIDRENPRKALVTIDKAAELIKTDQVSIGVYPEGTRSKTGDMLPFHNGVFKIAQRARVPIVVVAIQGAENIHKNVPLRRTTVRLDVVDVIPAEEVCGTATALIGGRVRSKIKTVISKEMETA